MCGRDVRGWKGWRVLALDKLSIDDRHCVTGVVDAVDLSSPSCRGLESQLGGVSLVESRPR